MSKPIPDTTVVIILPKLEREAKNSAWFSALEQHAVLIANDEVSAANLPKWIANRLAQQGQQASPQTLDFLANQVEGNLLAANQEVQKLGLLYPQGELTDEAVREAVLNVSRFDAFQLGEAVLLGDAARTARIFGDKQALTKRALARLSLRQLEAALQKLADIDKTAKGVMLGDAWLEISRLCFGLAKVRGR